MALLSSAQASERRRLVVRAMVWRRDLYARVDGRQWQPARIHTPFDEFGIHATTEDGKIRAIHMANVGVAHPPGSQVNSVVLGRDSSLPAFIEQGRALEAEDARRPLEVRAFCEACQTAQGPLLVLATNERALLQLVEQYI